MPIRVAVRASPFGSSQWSGARRFLDAMPARTMGASEVGTTASVSVLGVEEVFRSRRQGAVAVAPGDR